MKKRLRLFLPAFGIAIALLPQSAAAAWIIYCGELPGCPPTSGPPTSFIDEVLALLIADLPVLVYLLGGLFITIGGMYIVLSAGNSENLTKGKNTIIWAAAGIFAMEIVSNAATNPLTNFLLPELTDPNYQVSTSTGPALITNTINLAVSTVQGILYAALLGVALFSGARMVLSGGKDDQYNKGKEGLFWAAVGAIIINIAGALVTAFSTI